MLSVHFKRIVAARPVLAAARRFSSSRSGAFDIAITASTSAKAKQSSKADSSSPAASAATAADYSHPLPSFYRTAEHRDLFERTLRAPHADVHKLRASIMELTAKGRLDSAMVVLDALSKAKPAAASSTASPLNHPQAAAAAAAATSAKNNNQFIASPDVNPFESSAFFAPVNSNKPTKAGKAKSLRELAVQKLQQARARLLDALRRPDDLPAIERAHAKLVSFGAPAHPPVLIFLLSGYCAAADWASIRRVLDELERSNCALDVDAMRALMVYLTSRGHVEIAMAMMSHLSTLDMWRAASDAAFKKTTTTTGNNKPAK